MRIVISREEGMIRHGISHMGRIKVDHRDTVQMASLGTVWLGVLIWSQHIDCAVLIVITPWEGGGRYLFLLEKFK